MIISILYPLFCIILPCLIYQIITIKSYNLKDIKYLTPHLIWVYIFLLYIYLALSKAGIGSLWDIGEYSEIIRLQEINLIPFRSSGILTYILNIIMFMPLGFLLPLIWKDFRSFAKVFYTGLGFSLAIEICQLFNHRATDIDDLLMNSLGAILGYFIWVCISSLVESIKEKLVFLSKSIDSNTSISLDKNEAIIYLLLAILSEFLLYNWRFLY